jgi:hypothetical protein
MNDRVLLTTTDILAAASEYLIDAGYRRIDSVELGRLAKTGVRLFEDAYGIVAVAVYDTWRELSESWPEAQAALVEVISQHIGQSEAKAWDGYLVLFTPSILASEARLEAANIRYNTSRLRKLVAAGDELRTLLDVQRAVLPLLPLEANVELKDQESALEVLPELLSEKGLPQQAVTVVIQAFLEQLPILESLHSHETER